MTVSGLTNKITLSCSGTQTNFDFDFGYLNNSDIQVYLPNIDGDANDSNKQTEGSDYDLISTDKSAGGTVAFKSVPPATKEVFIVREVPLTQTVPFKPNTNFPEKLIETGLDKLTMGLQQLDERVGRAVTFPPNSDMTRVSISEPEANKALKWSADGKNLVNSTYDVDTAVVESAAFAAESAASAAESAASAAESAASAAGAKQSETKAQGYEDQAEYWAKQAAASIQQRVLNELIMSPVPLISAALHLADGTLLQYGANAQYIDYMIEYKKTYPGAFVIESEWQRLVSENGVCGKFVLDESAKTLRLPKLSGYLEGTLEESELGSFTKAKLPNIKGSLEVYLRFGPATGGAFELIPASDGIKNVTGQIYNASNTTNFDASLSNPIYSDDATTVQTDSTKVYYYLVVATGVRTDVQIDINKIITDINQINNDLIGKVDTSDMIEAPCIVESYLSDDGLNGYDVYSNKKCVQWGLLEHVGMITVHEDTINLLKQYRDTKYNITCTQYGVNPTNSKSANGVQYQLQSTNSFKFYHTAAANGIFWQTIGYLP
jgi:hypothetical protein